MSKTDELRRLIAEATPGPWTWEHNAAYLEGPPRDDSEFYGPIICGTHDDKAKQNARLIEFLRNNAQHFLEIITLTNRLLKYYGRDEAEAFVARNKLIETIAKFEGGGG